MQLKLPKMARALHRPSDSALRTLEAKKNSARPSLWSPRSEVKLNQEENKGSISNPIIDNSSQFLRVKVSTMPAEEAHSEESQQL